jgi:hypothetical protein
MTMTLGKFPPKDYLDVIAYDDDECVAGYRAHNINDDPPGDNHSPGYRWGWLNARRDATRVDDGYEQIRSDYIQWTKVLQ